VSDCPAQTGPAVLPNRVIAGLDGLAKNIRKQRRGRWRR
jgi:hypothetical protein